MDETKANKLPPIIVDFIEKMNNPNTATFTRDLYASNLEAIRDAADAALAHYASNRNRKTARR
jgi:hypothetical protein